MLVINEDYKFLKLDDGIHFSFRDPEYSEIPTIGHLPAEDVEEFLDALKNNRCFRAGNPQEPVSMNIQDQGGWMNIYILSGSIRESCWVRDNNVELIKRYLLGDAYHDS